MFRLLHDGSGFALARRHPGARAGNAYLAELTVPDAATMKLRGYVGIATDRAARANAADRAGVDPR